MKQILADITPVGSNNLFVTHYWPDKQTDPPLHYHEDYMLCLTLHVRGQRIMDDAVEDFTEKDLVLINPGTPHRFKRDAAYADAKYQDDRVRRIVRFVEESYSRKLSLEEIGRSVDMSPSSVCRYFKRRTHQNLWEYINSFRINRAAQLIVETQLPISEIGPRCGFTNVSNFNHLFRAHLGTTPSDYRSRFKTSPLTPDTTN